MNKIFENEDILVVNKPSGLVVNRSRTIKEETLQDQILAYLKLKKDDLGIAGRAGIVHRIDRETSGLLVVAKNQETLDFLQGEFAQRKVKKEYLALVHGVLEKGGVVSASIARVGKFGKFGISKLGRESETEYQIVSNYKFPNSSYKKIVEVQNLNRSRQRYLEKNGLNYTLLSVLPKTGRTHQIRVHLKSIGHPVVSDQIYTPSKLLKFDFQWCGRLFLHAKRISFFLPKEKGKKKLSEFVFEVPMPYDLVAALGSLKKLPDGNL